MKNLLLILYFTGIFFPANLFSQSVFRENTKWVILLVEAGEFGVSHYRVYENYIDSVVKGVEYCHLKVYIGKNYSKENYTVVNKKVFVKDNPYNHPPNPVYNFNLKAGEFVGGHKIDSVNTIVCNGRELMVQYLTGGLILMEGFGCITKGFVYWDDFDNGGSWGGHWYICRRICINDTGYAPMLKNNTPQFLSTPCMDSAYQQMVDIKNFNQSEILIFPNPLKDQLYIKNFKGEIELYNPTGTLLLAETMTNEINLDIQLLPKGIYYLKLKDNGNSQIRKVLKL